MRCGFGRLTRMLTTIWLWQRFRREAGILAEPAVVEALRLRPTSAEAWNNLGVILAAKKEFPKALEAHRRAMELLPNWPTARFAFGQTLVASGAKEQGLREMAAAIQMAPSKRNGGWSWRRSCGIADKSGELASLFAGFWQARWKRAFPNLACLLLSATRFACCAWGAAELQTFC